MTDLFQIRLLDKDRNVLAWKRLAGETHGDGAIWPTQNFFAEGEVDGMATDLSVAWPSMGVHTTVTLAMPIPVQAGHVVSVHLMGTPLMKMASDPRPLPPVVVRSAV